MNQALGFSATVYSFGAAEAGFFPGIIFYLTRPATLRSHRPRRSTRQSMLGRIHQAHDPGTQKHFERRGNAVRREKRAIRR
jgi:hypothetical protein